MAGGRKENEDNRHEAERGVEPQTVLCPFYPLWFGSLVRYSGDVYQVLKVKN